MPKLSGDEGRVLVGAQVVNDTVSFTLNWSGDRIETTTQTDDNKTYRAGLPDVSGTIEARYDETDTTGQGAIEQGQSVTLVLRPGGTGTGLPEFEGPAEIIGETIESAQGGTVSRTYEWAANGDWTRSLQA